MRIVPGVLCGFAFLALADNSASAQNLSTYGTPGLVDMPTAEQLPDGYLSFSAAVFENTARGATTFQMLPRVYGTFRYSYLRDFSQIGSRYDRSFDVHFQLLEESGRRPGVGLGLRDIGGTGIYGAEYLVLTKSLARRWKLTGGIGWGRLGQRGGFDNPLSVFGDRFETRPERGGGEGGQLSADHWFRGSAALFGGVEYELSARTALIAEYSSDNYREEGGQMGFDAGFPLNFGLRYRFDNGVAVNGFLLHGTAAGLQVSYVLDPRRPAAPGGQGRAGPALLPPEQAGAANWALGGDGGDLTARDVLRVRLERQGIRMTGFLIEGGTASVEIENNQFPAAAQAVGRTARIMANTLDPLIETFDITLARNGVTVTTVRTQRAALYQLETDLDGAWRTLARSEIRDQVAGLPHGSAEGSFPHFGYRFGPYLRLSFFDPDNPLRYELGAALSADYVAQPGLFLSGTVRYPILNTLADTARVSDSTLPRVRSDWAEYAKQSDLQINELTANYLWRPGPDMFARVTGGYLEEMFAGLSGEMLWYPNGSRIALGAELNFVRQRDFDMLFGLQDYDVLTGHGSVYYEMDRDYLLQVDAGRYLAGDWGVTIGLDREFNNGFRVGAFATFTDVSSEEFGEGSFDKGVRFEIPVSWLTGRPTRTTLNQTIRPVLRDGGARLNVQNRLYGYTRDERVGRIVGQWGRFYR